MLLFEDLAQQNLFRSGGDHFTEKRRIRMPMPANAGSKCPVSIELHGITPVVRRSGFAARVLASGRQSDVPADVIGRDCTVVGRSARQSRDVHSVVGEYPAAAALRKTVIELVATRQRSRHPATRGDDPR
ncbi:MAG: hypothetical protein QM766_07255 [Burkholderiaceae bacterium]